MPERDAIWTPPPDALQTTIVGRYLRWLRDQRRLDLADWKQLHEWSAADLDGFCRSGWDFFEVRAGGHPSSVRGGDIMPDVRWFPRTRLNYVEHMLGRPADRERVAIVERTQTRPVVQLTLADLADQVARAASGLRSLGVGTEKVGAAYLANIQETVIAFITTASLGAIWACCSPEFLPRAVIDRCAQLKPKVLLSVSRYGFRDRQIDRSDAHAAIVAGLPSMEQVVDAPYGNHPAPGGISWADLLARTAPLTFVRVPFDHPLYVLFSSGTTGLPKAIIHVHGGILIEHRTTLALSWDLDERGRLLQFTTTGGMMWNTLVSALLARASIVLIDGRSDLARRRPAVAARGRDCNHHARHQPSGGDGMPQGLRTAGRAGPRGAQGDHHRRLIATRRRLPVVLREARIRRAADQRQRRHRRLQRVRVGLVSAAGVCGRDQRRLPRC
jgi:acetoacetyl-CoA synthetase